MRHQFTCVQCGSSYFRPPCKAGQFCSRQCHGIYKRRTLEQRFWASVDKSGECWLWTASTNAGGYGLIGIEGTRAGLAHRVSWTIHNGPIPKGLFVCHHCDNPPCVRPDHLFLGTSSDNQLDSGSKGRHWTQKYPDRVFKGDRNPSRRFPEKIKRGAKSWMHQHPEAVRGERNGNAKLTNEQVSMIRTRYADGGVFYRELADEYGVSLSLVCMIVKGKHWRHLPG